MTGPASRGSSRARPGAAAGGYAGAVSELPATAFVTGGSGFIGGRLVKRLAGGGCQVRALARSEASAAAIAELGAEPVRGDLADAASIAAVLAITLLPFSVLGPFVGVVLDRWSRRQILVVVDLSRAAIAVGLAGMVATGLRDG